MKNIINYLYNNSPVYLQNIIISTYGYTLKKSRYGERFNIELSAFRDRESYTSQKWRDYQTIELRKLLIHAFSSVPYYHETYKKHGFKLTDFNKFELEHLYKLPFLEKEDFRKYGKTTLLSRKKGKGSLYLVAVVQEHLQVLIILIILNKLGLLLMSLEFAIGQV